MTEVGALDMLCAGLAEALAEGGVSVQPIPGSSAAAMAARFRVLLVDLRNPHAQDFPTLEDLRCSAPGVQIVGVAGDGSSSSRASGGDFDVFFSDPSARPALLAYLKAAGAVPSRTVQVNRVVRAWGFPILAILVPWYFATGLLRMPAYLVPSPASVARAAAENGGEVLSDLFITSLEAACGLIIGNAAGLLTAVALFRSRWLKSLSYPAIAALQAVPIIALAPLFVIWLGSGLAAKIAMASLICFFPIVANLLASFDTVDSSLAEIFTFYRARYIYRLGLLLLPASAASLIGAARISGGLAVVGAIVAEFTGSDTGVGHLLLNATYRFDAPLLFCGIFAAGILGLFFTYIPSFALELVLNSAYHLRNRVRQVTDGLGNNQ